MTHAVVERDQDTHFAKLILNDLVSTDAVDAELLVQLSQGLADPAKREVIFAISGCVNDRKIETIVQFVRTVVAGAKDPSHDDCDCDLRGMCQVFTDR